MTCANRSPPMGLSWQNITVSQDEHAASRGVALAVGNPQQIISLRPSTGDANTWVYNSIDCVTTTNDSCIGSAGGVYNFKDSDTFVQSTEEAWNGTQEAAIFSQADYIFFNDQIRFGSNGSSLGFPLVMDRNGYGVQSGLGLAPGSTFLDAAVTSGSAPTKAWSIWVGSRSVTEPVEGALWIGGYDTSRVAGEFTDFTTYDLCPTCVIVTNITYEYAGGSASLFSNDTETLLVALEPYVRTLNVPEDIFLNFARASGGTVGTDPGTTGLLTFPPSTEFGNLSITLKNGYQTNIPSKEFFLPPRSFNKEGIYSIANDSYLVAGLANSTVEPQHAFDWGIPYLVMNYMVLDYDQKSFRMAPAVQGPWGVGQGSLVEPLCKGIAAESASAAITPSATGASASPTATPDHHHDTNVGAIAGGVVGGVLGLAIVGVLLFLLFRSRGKEKTAKTERDAAVAENLGKTDRMSQYTGTSPTEVSEMPQAGSGSKNINQWLHNQNTANEHQGPPISATMNRPSEMPADSPQHN